MKVNASIITLFLLSLGCNAQTKTYLDNNRWETKKKSATYLQTSEAIGSKYLIQEFLIEGNVLLKKTYAQSIDPLIKEGSYEQYYRNGNLREKGIYLNDKKNGFWEDYYEVGQIESKYVVRNDTSYYCQYWTENGDSILFSGNGVLSFQDEKQQRNVTTIFKDSLRYTTFFTFYNSSDTIYDIVTTQPEFIGGYQQFYSNVGESMKYPIEARRNGTMGKVYVQFVVTPNGELEHVKVVKGIGSGCDEEAKDAVLRSSGNWISGEHEGKKVKTRMVLPIAFKLG